MRPDSVGMLDLTRCGSHRSPLGAACRELSHQLPVATEEPVLTRRVQMDEMSIFEGIDQPGDENVDNGMPSLDLSFPNVNDMGDLADLALLQAAIHGGGNLDGGVTDDAVAESKVDAEREADAEDEEDVEGDMDAGGEAGADADGDAEGDADGDADSEVAAVKVEDTDDELLRIRTKSTSEGSTPIDSDIDMLRDEVLVLPPTVRFEVAIPALSEEEKSEYSVVYSNVVEYITGISDLGQDVQQYDVEFTDGRVESVRPRTALHMHTRTSLLSMHLPNCPIVQAL